MDEPLTRDLPSDHVLFRVLWLMIHRRPGGEITVKEQDLVSVEDEGHAISVTWGDGTVTYRAVSRE